MALYSARVFRDQLREDSYGYGIKDKRPIQQLDRSGRVMTLSGVTETYGLTVAQQQPVTPPVGCRNDTDYPGP